MIGCTHVTLWYYFFKKPYVKNKEYIILLNYE